MSNCCLPYNHHRGKRRPNWRWKSKITTLYKVTWIRNLNCNRNNESLFRCLKLEINLFLLRELTLTALRSSWVELLTNTGRKDVSRYRNSMRPLYKFRVLHFFIDAHKIKSDLTYFLKLLQQEIILNKCLLSSLIKTKV